MATTAHTILIVEDDDDSRTLLGHLLTAQGYRVAMARNGLEGLRAARSCHPALILLDVQMPVMDGVAFRRHQMEDPAIADIPVVCVSALDSGGLRVGSLGAVQFVRKPIDFDCLLAIVGDAMTAAAFAGAGGQPTLTAARYGSSRTVAAGRRHLGR